MDRQLVYEATSRTAFEGLRATGRSVRRPSASLAMADHTLATRILEGVPDRRNRLVDELRETCASAGIPFLGRDDLRLGIVHVVGPEKGSLSLGYYDQEGTWADGGRAICQGRMFDRGGGLVVTVMQEGMVRRRP